MEETVKLFLQEHDWNR